MSPSLIDRAQLHKQLLEMIAAKDTQNLKTALAENAARFNEQDDANMYTIFDEEDAQNKTHVSGIRYIHEGLKSGALSSQDADDVLKKIIPIAIQKEDFFEDIRNFISDPKVNHAKSTVLTAIDKNSPDLSLGVSQSTVTIAVFDGYFHRDENTQKALEPFMKQKVADAQRPQRHGWDELYFQESRPHLAKFFNNDQQVEKKENAFFARFAAAEYYRHAGVKASDAPTLTESDIDPTANAFKLQMNKSDTANNGGNRNTPRLLGENLGNTITKLSKHLVLPAYLQAMRDKQEEPPKGMIGKLEAHAQEKTFQNFFGASAMQDHLTVNRTMKMVERLEKHGANIKGAIPKNDQMQWSPVLPEGYVGKNGYAIREITDYQELRAEAKGFNNCAADHLETLLTQNGHAFVMEKVHENGQFEKLMAEFQIEEDPQTGKLSFKITERPDQPRATYEFVSRGEQDAQEDFSQLVDDFKSEKIQVDWKTQQQDKQVREEAGYTEVCDYNPYNPDARQGVFEAYTRVALATNTDYRRLKGIETHDDFVKVSGIADDAEKTATSLLSKSQFESFEPVSSPVIQMPVAQNRLRQVVAV